MPSGLIRFEPVKTKWTHQILCSVLWALQKKKKKKFMEASTAELSGEVVLVEERCYHVEGVVGLEKCFSGYQNRINVYARIQVFPAEHCSITGEHCSPTLPTSGHNVFFDRCIHCKESQVSLVWVFHIRLVLNIKCLKESKHLLIKVWKNIAVWSQFCMFC